MSLQEVIGLTDQPRNLVSEFKRRLQAQIGFNCFELWFNAVDSIYQDGTSLAVSAADEFSMDRIKSSYGEKINRIAGEMAIAPIRFVVQAGDTGRSNGSTASEKAISSNPLDAVTADKSPKSVQVLKLVSNSGQTCSGQTCSGQTGSGNPDSARKSPSIQAKTEKPIKHSGARFRYSLRDFVFDSENQILRNACKQILDSPGELSPFYLFGRSGCGKTHLLEGLATEARKRTRAGRVQLVTAEQFTSDYIGSLKNRTMPFFRKRYRELDFLLVDDLQFFAGKASTLGELQHTIEVVTRKGGQVVVSADRSPHELDFAGPEFIHRVACGLTTQILPPTKETRQQIVTRIAAQKGIRLEPCAVQLIASAISGDARLIMGALNRIKLYQLIKGESITAADARQYLSDLLQISHRTVTMSDIEDAVCGLFGLERKTLRSATKVKAVSQPRMLAMWLSRKYTRAALSEIGDHFGGRSHSTVLSAQSKVDKWVEKCELIGLKHSAFPIENAIRRIEQELRIG